MIDEVTAGIKVKLREKISDSVPVGSIATVLYIDDLDNVFIEWVSNGRLTSFSKKNFKSLFEIAGWYMQDWAVALKQRLFSFQLCKFCLSDLL